MDEKAITVVYAHDGRTCDKVMSVQGCIDALKMRVNWFEESFDKVRYP